MKQKKVATIFTAIIFIACVVFLRIHFSKPTESETIVKANYYIENLETPQIKAENGNYIMTVTATQGTELYIEVTNRTPKEMKFEEKILLYRVTIDDTRVKVDDKPVKVYITRGHGRAEIVKSIPSQGTRELVLDCSALGMITPGSYVVHIHGQNLFFTLEDNPAM